ncbi:MAG: hypothetical protein FD127_3982, partial [Acidimicrobiaceae bacterium]
PDQILYTWLGINEPAPALVAWALIGDTYTEIARSLQWIGDVPAGLSATGFYIGGPDNVVMSYLGPDGKPSGATLDTPTITQSFDRQVVTISNGAMTWTLYYTNYDCLTIGGLDCAYAQPGPNGTVVVSDYFRAESAPMPGNKPTVGRITLLTDTSSAIWDIPWTYIGPTGDNLLVVANRSDRFQIGILTP